jgi:hypothetical protein
MNPFIQQLLNTARNTAVRAATAIDVQARRNMGPQVRRVLGQGALNPYSNPIVSAAKKDPSKLTAGVRGFLVAPGVRSYGGLVGGAVALDAANSTGLTGAIEGGLNQVGPGLDRFFGAVTPKPVQDFGRSMEQYGWGALNGFVPGEITAASVSTPERAKGTQAILNGKPVYWTGSKYGWQSGPSAAKAGLLGSEVVGDDVFAPVIGTTLTPPAAPILPAPTQGAADRAYQSAKAETAAMVATDPLMQQWSAAQKAKDYTTADQLGKQIWQNRYGGGPMGQPGGAIGSKNPLMDSTFVYQTGMSPGDIAKTITNPSDIPVSPGEAPYQTGDFGTRLGENGYDATKYGITPEMIEEIRKRQGVEEMKNRLLQQASTK